jgi:hypothetical protein
MRFLVFYSLPVAVFNFCCHNERHGFDHRKGSFSDAIAELTVTFSRLNKVFLIKEPGFLVVST